ncbi:hypothetical protein EJ110_NYTH46508 [Nymphaea thermarum]|nr:hypothetical protein EJ110_NYTH46508 [Nymphaea thermarum]
MDEGDVSKSSTLPGTAAAREGDGMSPFDWWASYGSEMPEDCCCCLTISLSLPIRNHRSERSTDRRSLYSEISSPDSKRFAALPQKPYSPEDTRTEREIEGEGASFNLRRAQRKSRVSPSRGSDVLDRSNLIHLDCWG